MKVIADGDSRVINLLGIQKTAFQDYKRSPFLLEERNGNTTVLFNTLTREILSLDGNEYSTFFSSQYAQSRWYSFPSSENPGELLEKIRTILHSIDCKRDPKHNRKYVIFTTTACNARCFYCFEGSEKKSTHMSLKTADMVGKYIALSGGENISLTWFGGEPLMNTAAIDHICAYLKNTNTMFSSTLYSNGLLFGSDLINQAKHFWNTELVEITLDGRGQYYNCIKRYRTNIKDPYQIVLDHIDKLSAASVHVSIRLNVGLDNVDELRNLLDELVLKYSCNPYVSVNLEKLYQRIQSQCVYSEEEYSQIIKNYHTLYEYAAPLNILAHNRHPLRKFKSSNCYADTGEGVAILPEGQLCLCEHYTHQFFAGDVWAPVSCAEDRALFSKRTIYEKCMICPAYPTCINMQYCDLHPSFCNDTRQEEMIQKEQDSLRQILEK